MPGVRSRPDAIAIPPSERRLLFRLQAEHALYPALSQSPPAPAHNPLSLPVSLPHPRLAPSADTLVMVVCLLPGGTQVCPSGRSQPPDSGSSPGGNRPLRLRHHHTEAPLHFGIISAASRRGCGRRASTVALATEPSAVGVGHPSQICYQVLPQAALGPTAAPWSNPKHNHAIA